MSPVTLFYLLLASPMFSSHFGGEFDREHGMDSWFTPSWSNWSPMESRWGYSPMNWESSIFSTPYESTFESPMNWLHTPVHHTSRRSILRELAGVEHPFEHSTLSTPLRKIVKLNALSKIIRRIAEVNPIMIEKILSCPETRVVLSKVLRSVEPETLVLVEKMIKKNIPTYIREKVTRRVLKNLVRSNIFSSKRSSILSELYPTTFESTFESSPIFSNIFSNIFSAEESPLFSGAYSPKKVSKIVRRLLKNVERRHHTYEPTMESLLMSAEESPIFSKKNIFSNIFSEESPIFSGVYSPKKVAKVVRRLLKNVERRHHSFEPTMESLLMTSEVKPVEKLILKKLVKKVIRNPYTRVHFCNVCENVCTGYTATYNMPVCRVCHEVCPTTSFSSKLSWF